MEEHKVLITHLVGSFCNTPYTPKLDQQCLGFDSPEFWNKLYCCQDTRIDSLGPFSDEAEWVGVRPLFLENLHKEKLTMYDLNINSLTDQKELF